MSELKPCPFCGGKNLDVNDKDEDFRDHLIFVACRDCGAIGGASDGDCEETLEVYVQYAINAWNRRATNGD